MPVNGGRMGHSIHDRDGSALTAIENQRRTGNFDGIGSRLSTTLKHKSPRDVVSTVSDSLLREDPHTVLRRVRSDGWRCVRYGNPQHETGHGLLGMTRDVVRVVHAHGVRAFRVWRDMRRHVTVHEPVAGAGGSPLQ